jgi:thiamine pyrophosphate-dependent acetolactate synthase large subunit-like protein
MGEKSSALLSIGNPAIDWVQLAGSFGVEGWRVNTMEDLDARFVAALSESGPKLIEIDM